MNCETLLFERPGMALPPGINAVTTTRQGGVSSGAFDSLNLAEHVGDDQASVARNRTLLRSGLNLPAEPFWLRQVHSDRIATSGEADGSYSSRRGEVLCIQSADCLPIVIWDNSGEEIAALHGGWQGLALGIVGKVIGCFKSNDLSAWIGPHVNACHYEVDQKLFEKFGQYPGVFAEGRDSQHWQLSLAGVATQQLRAMGVAEIGQSVSCTACDQDRYFSYRRDGECGRMATLIWIS